jgi:Predicted xylanase/chitin deacetylase
MYFGSVKFFKHLIVVSILLLFVGLLISTICLSAINKNYKKQIAEEKSGVVLAQANVKEPSMQRSVSIDYQELYPDMYAKLPEKTIEKSKTIYLTFDDGPSDRTIEVLDILKEKNVKATFFVTGKDSEEDRAIMKRIVDEGHTIGIHTYSHVYDDIYASVENYLADFNKIYNLIYDATGVKPEVFRFPGGSINRYNSCDQEEITAEMTRRGFTYYDWNASSGDANSSASRSSVLTNSIQTSQNKDRIILLMHDSINKSYTVEALGEIIDYFKTQGYEFDKITNEVRPIAFNYNDY